MSSFAFGHSLFSGMTFNSKERLTKALKENRNSYTISRDGYVSLDLKNADVLKALEEQIEKIGEIKEEKRDHR